MRHAEGPCVDEQDCSWERATLCAFDASTTTDQQVYFLRCMDEVRVGTALNAAGKCASDPSVSPAITGITECFNDKAKSDALLKSAEADWNKAFPQRATIPHVFVNGADTHASYTAIHDALCSEGSSAAACNKYVAPTVV